MLSAPAGVLYVTMPHNREGVKKNWEKAVRLTAWVDPPLPQSGQVNVKNSYFAVLYRIKMGQNFHKYKRSGWGGGDPPPPQSGQPDRFFPVFFYAFFLRSEATF